MSSSDELIRLSPDEAFVLYDFAHRLVLDISAKEVEAIFEDRGEWMALSSVLGQLETRLPPDLHAGLPRTASCGARAPAAFG
ncbi:hypothetical protein [Actinomadura geliboluensis]|uniref:hypothetical protein n=1 Tax=Actinomadura geliboluensis TaxID=882440 RepID=UPI003713A38F